MSRSRTRTLVDTRPCLGKHVQLLTPRDTLAPQRMQPGDGHERRALRTNEGLFGGCQPGLDGTLQSTPALSPYAATLVPHPRITLRPTPRDANLLPDLSTQELQTPLAGDVVDTLPKRPHDNQRHRLRAVE